MYFLLFGWGLQIKRHNDRVVLWMSWSNNRNNKFWQIVWICIWRETRAARRERWRFFFGGGNIVSWKPLVVQVSKKWTSRTSDEYGRISTNTANGDQVPVRWTIWKFGVNTTLTQVQRNQSNSTFHPIVMSIDSVQSDDVGLAHQRRSRTNEWYQKLSSAFL